MRLPCAFPSEYDSDPGGIVVKIKGRHEISDVYRLRKIIEPLVGCVGFPERPAVQLHLLPPNDTLEPGHPQLVRQLSRNPGTGQPTRRGIARLLMMVRLPVTSGLFTPREAVQQPLWASRFEVELQLVSFDLGDGAVAAIGSKEVLTDQQTRAVRGRSSRRTPPMPHAAAIQIVCRGPRAPRARTVCSCAWKPARRRRAVKRGSGAEDQMPSTPPGASAAPARARPAGS